MRLKTYDTAPPGNWRYTEPTTGFTSMGITIRQLLDRVRQHRLNNNIPIGPHLLEEVERAICAALSPADQIEFCGTGLREPAGLHWGEVQKFMATATAFIKSGGALVPQEEAERRTAICVTCPYNVGMYGCAPCRLIVDGLRVAVLQRSTSQDAALNNCGVCGCDLKTMAHIPLDVLRAGEAGRELVYPDWCWKKAAVANESQP